MKNIPSYDELLKGCLDKIPTHIYKGEGGLIYDALAPACFELAQAYMEIENVLNITYADTSSGDYLTRRASERGVYRKQATQAIRKGVFNKMIPINSRFAIEDATYKNIKHISGFEYELQCEQYGKIGNIYSGPLNPLDSIDGLTDSQLTDILIPGEEEEDDESLRNRYFENIESESFGGNISDYKKKTKSLTGVGGVKVYPTWAGGGTVKLVIINSVFAKPSISLINEVQTIIDPVQNKGKGVGIAPIGHVVTVEGVEETSVNIESSISLVSGYSWADVKPHIESTIIDYFNDLSSTWDSQEKLVARVSYIEARILQVTGVLDVQFTKLNGSLNNLILGANNIPKIGAVTKV